MMGLTLYSLAILFNVLSTRGDRLRTGSDDCEKNLPKNVGQTETQSVISSHPGAFLKCESASYGDHSQTDINSRNFSWNNTDLETFPGAKTLPKVGEEYDDQNEARMFGIRRRMQLFLFLPISFKLGIILTLLLVVTTISAKTLLLGFVILLLLAHNIYHGHSKWLGVSRSPELSHEQWHKSVHIHVHNVVPESHSPLYYRQDSWHDSSQPLTDNGVHYEHA